MQRSQKMKMVHLSYAAPLLILVLGCCGNATENTEPDGYSDVRPSPVLERTSKSGDCDDLPDELMNFKADDDARKQAEANVLGIAKRSQACRDLAVRMLIEMVQGENEKVIRSAEGRRQWETITDALGELGAKEAVRPLADHLTVNGGTYAFGLGIYPAVTALVKLGDASLPTLTSMACRSKSEIEREQSLSAIYAIHTNAAVAALKSTSEEASDAGIRERAAQLYLELKLRAKANSNGNALENLNSHR
jgi:HEAT repeat protein